MNRYRYAIALGSNRPSRLGSPRQAIEAAIGALGDLGTIVGRSSIFATPALGPARRRFANAAAILGSELEPMALLAKLKRIEREAGRRAGKRWGDRVIDLDIALWSEGAFRTRLLAIPHRELVRRSFVLEPLREIAPDWRLPRSALRIRHLRARLTRPHPSA